jgi:hypothetical protein
MELVMSEMERQVTLRARNHLPLKKTVWVPEFSCDPGLATEPSVNNRAIELIHCLEMRLALIIRVEFHQQWIIVKWEPFAGRQRQWPLIDLMPRLIITGSFRYCPKMPMPGTPRRSDM